MAVAAVAFAAPKPAGTIEHIEHMGALIRECSLVGERRRITWCRPMPTGSSKSENRWMLIYATRGFRGNDDDRSIVFQLRSETPDGRVIKEGIFSSSQADWDPDGEGKVSYFKQLGHPVLFGVPRGARVGGRPALSANVFVAKWRTTAWLPVLDRGEIFPAAEALAGHPGGRVGAVPAQRSQATSRSFSPSSCCDRERL